MESVTKFSVWVITILSLPCLFLLLRRKKNSGDRNLPPGPPGWPIIGNMFDLGALPHRTLAQLKDKYGGVIWLRLGSTNTMAIVSAEATTELFKNHDLSFAERPISETMRGHGYSDGSIALAPYGPYWRVLRRLLTSELMSNKRLNETAPIRKKCVDDMVTWIEEEAEKVKRTRGGGRGRGRGVKITDVLGLTMVNLIGNLMVSRDLFGPKSEVGPKFVEAMDTMIESTGQSCIADFFPWLKRFYPQDMIMKMDRALGRALELASVFLKDRRKEHLTTADDRSEKRKDFLDVMLEFQGNEKEGLAKFSDNQINVVILEIFMASADTSSVTIEWAMSELLRNPKVMSKVKAELNRVVGRNRKLEESDMVNLPYLQAVVKESMRLHPAVPLLVPRRAVRDTKFMGYDIPKGTQVFVDIWGISRDPKIWEDPLSFKPERFLGSTVDYKDQNYEYIPFGAGRRMCAGAALAHRFLHLVLGTLLHEFDWEVDGYEALDMGERLGFTMKKLKPLLVVPKKRIS